MRRWIAGLLTVGLVAVPGAVANGNPTPLNTAAPPTGAAKPAEPSSGKVSAQSAATSVTSVWQVYFGGWYTSNPPTVYSNRNPTWDTHTNPGLVFTTTGELRETATFCNGGLCWRTGTAPTLPAMLRWARDGNTFIQGALHDVPWETGVMLGDTAAARMILWSNGCLITYWWTGYQWNNAWSNSSNPACAIYLS